MFTRHDSLKAGYEVVIIGAGGHGLAAAYYLARDHGVRDVAVLEKGYIGGGNTGRNTTITRSRTRTLRCAPCAGGRRSTSTSACAPKPSMRPSSSAQFR